MCDQPKTPAEPLDDITLWGDDIPDDIPDDDVCFDDYEVCVGCGQPVNYCLCHEFYV